jgi:hypothetical protein
MPSGVIGGVGGLFGTGTADALTLTPSLAGGTSADAGQATLTASGTPHADAAGWTDLIASSTADAAGIAIGLRSTVAASATDTSTLLDIALGAAASEVALVTSIPIGWKMLGYTVDIPCPVPSGSRVSARIRSITASKVVDVTARLLDGPTVTAPDTIGAVPASSRGTLLPAATNATTPGSWQNIGSTTGQAYQAVLVGIQGGADSTMAASGVRVDIGIASTRIGTTWWHAFGTESYIAVGSPLLTVNVPAGSQLQAQTYGAAGNTIDVILHGIPA